jgi:hypothetical protein
MEYLKFVRFVFPFLFVRNWFDGTWELSRPRLILGAFGVGLFLLAFLIAYYLQLPVEYVTRGGHRTPYSSSRSRAVCVGVVSGGA